MMKNILIVDDEIINIKILERVLSRNSYNSISTTNSVDVMKLLTKNTIDLILLDIQMPKLDGFHLATMLKKDVIFRDIPIIFLTGMAEGNIIAKAFEIGCSDYISKPFKKEELLARIKTHLKIKDMENVLKNKNKELSKFIEQKNQFLGIAAHDIRNPLGVISGYTDILLSMGNSDEKYLKILDNMNKSSKHILSIVNDLLEFTKYSSDKMNLKLKEININDFFEEIISMNRIISEQKEISITLENRTKDDLKINIDPEKMTQVMNNLISNGVKYSNKNTTIAVIIKQQDNNLLITVKDQGQGIQKDELYKLFKPFSTTTNKSTAGERSTGLGLTIVKSIIEKHNGKIGVESEWQKGSCFFIELPIK